MHAIWRQKMHAIWRQKMHAIWRQNTILIVATVNRANDTDSVRLFIIVRSNDVLLSDVSILTLWLWRSFCDPF